jgi:hypothetical protein
MLLLLLQAMKDTAPIGIVIAMGAGLFALVVTVVR